MMRTFAAAIGIVALLAAAPGITTEEGPDTSSSSDELVEVFAPDGTISRVAVPARTEPPLAPSEAAVLAESGLHALHVSGPSENRFDLVIMGDGYTAEEQDVFEDHARDKWDEIATTEPFASYLSFFNVWLVDVESAESGVDNDPYPPTERDTALDMEFWCSGIERLLCVNSSAARAAAEAAPDDDQILVLANSTKYGGAGGGVATSSGGNSAAGLITVHELGHSIGGLADEYDYYARAGLSDDSTDDVTIPAPYTYYPRVLFGEPDGVNITAEPDPEQMIDDELKWWRWVGEESPDGGTVATYEGGGYYRYGLYRPTEDSLMHSLGIADGGNEFNLPSREEMIARFHHAVDLIDANTAEGPVAADTTVTVDLVQPTSHQLEVRWSLDGAEVESARGATTFPVTATLAEEHDSLTVTVTDPTEYVRDPAHREGPLTQTITWDI